MRFSPCIAFIFLLLFSIAEKGAAQARSKTDSLHDIVNAGKKDTLRALALCELALDFRNAGELDSAFYYGQQALTLSRELKYNHGHAFAVYQLGIIASTRANYVEALQMLSQSADLYKAGGEKKGYASAVSAMGGQKILLGDPTGALDYYLKALKIKEELGDSSILASTVANIGGVYNNMLNYKEALKYHLQSLRLNQKYGKIKNLPTDYYNVANVYSNMSNDSLAILNLGYSEGLADSLGQAENLMYVYNLRAKILKKRKDYTAALTNYEKAIAIAERIKDQRMLSFAYMAVGLTYSEIGNKGKAEFYMLQAADIAKQIHEPHALYEAQRALSAFYKTHGNYKKALQYYEAFVVTRDSVFNDEKKQEVLKKQMNFEFDKKQALAKAEEKKKDELAQAEQQRKDALVEEDKKRKMIIIYAGAFVLLLVLIFLVVSQRQKKIIATQKTEVEQQRDRVEKQKEIIQEKNKDITDSINYAQRIQQAILPDPELFKKLLPDSFIFYRPKDIVSGDFYWVSERDNIVYYATADCTGHGVPGGFMSVLGASLLNEVINEKGVTQPGEILDMLRDKIIAALRQKGETGENKDGIDMVLCRFDRSKNELIFAAANNPVWLVQHVGGERKLVEFSPDKQPVGIGTLNPAPFSQHACTLQPGDMVFTFTDGFADQFGGPKGKKFKYRQFQETLVSVCNLPVETQYAQLDKTFEEWKGNLEQTDDVLLIGIKIA
jgi:serine phosphatase RsbU (regulator of sigma subunit)